MQDQTVAKNEVNKVKPDNNKARRWAFTWNNYTEDNVNYLKSLTDKQCDYIVFGFEKAPDTGTPHLQGYIEFSTPLTQLTTKGRLDPILKKKSPVHIKSAYKVRQANFNYCTKSDTKDAEAIAKYGGEYIEVIHRQKEQGKRTDWHDMYDFLKDKPDFAEFAEVYPETAIKYASGIDRVIAGIIDKQSKDEVTAEYAEIKLRPWQEKLKNELLGKADKRKIIWLYDSGNTGKSTFSTYMSLLHGAIVYENAKSRDLAHMYKREPIVFFDFTCSLEGKVNYSIIEALKNQRLTSTKYNGCTKYFKKPHVVVFANWLPDTSKLIADRWDIRSLREFYELDNQNKANSITHKEMPRPEEEICLSRDVQDVISTTKEVETATHPRNTDLKIEIADDIIKGVRNPDALFNKSDIPQNDNISDEEINFMEFIEPEKCLEDILSGI